EPVRGIESHSPLQTARVHCTPGLYADRVPARRLSTQGLRRAAALAGWGTRVGVAPGYCVGLITPASLAGLLGRVFTPAILAGESAVRSTRAQHLERRYSMPVQTFAPMTKDFATFDCDAHVTEPPKIWERAHEYLTRDELEALKATIWWDA